MGKKTRTEKWKKYRERIASTPDSEFEKESGNSISFSKVDRERLEGSVSPSYEPRLRTTPYKAFVARKRRDLLLKFVFLGITVAAFCLAYIFWVK